MLLLLVTNTFEYFIHYASTVLALDGIFPSVNLPKGGVDYNTLKRWHNG